MKYYLPLLTALVLCAGLCGCTPSEEPISAPEEPVSQPEVVLPLPDEVPVEEAPDFYEQVLMMYGAEEDPETGTLYALPVGPLSDAAVWDGPEAFTTGEAMGWFTSFIYSLSDEVKADRYASPLGDGYGYFYPAAELEATVSTYFEGVTPEMLRADTTLYRTAENGYQLPALPEDGERTAVALGEVDPEGDLRHIPLTLSAPDGTVTRLRLTIRLAADGSGYQFVRCVPDTAVAL